MDPLATLREAIESAQRGLQISATFAPAYGNLAHAYQILAEHEWSQGTDPRGDVERALQAARRALEFNPAMPNVLSYVASAHLVLAGHEMEHGRDPKESFERSRLAARKALAANPLYAEGHLVEGLVALLEARGRMSHKLDPAETFASSRRSLGAAERIKADDGRVHQALAELSLSEARWLIQNGRSGDAELKKGLDRTRQALALDPSLAEAVAVQGLLLMAKSQTLSGAERKALEEQGRAALQSALAANRNLTRRYAPFLERRQRTVEVPQFTAGAAAAPRAFSAGMKSETTA